MNLELALPILIPLSAGAVSIALWRSVRYQRIIAVLATALLLAASVWLLRSTIDQGFLVMEMGSWPAPFSIVFVSDLLSAIMIVLTGIIGLAIAIYSLASTPGGHEKFGYYPLMHLLLAGVAGSFLTGDIFNLFVWFEVMLLASFALLTLGGERAQMEGAIKYVTLNLFSSAIFLSAVGLLYGTVGTLNMADIAQKIATIEDPGLITVISMMFLVSFGIKAAAFPLFFWLPASYHTPQVAVSALFAGLLTKVGVYALYRFFTLIFTQDIDYTHTILLWVAALTMLTGVLGAAAQFEFRRILSFHIVSQIGYMILGLALFTPLAIIGGVFYIMHHIIVKTNLFLISGITYRLLGSYDLKDLGGVYKERPFLALLFLIPALSLAGIPPLSGFFAKFVVIRAGLEAEAYVVTGIALLVGLLTLYSMIKIWAEVFWKKTPEHVTDLRRLKGEVKEKHNWAYFAPVIGLAACTVFIGLNGQPIYELAEMAAHQLLNPQLYIEAVLGGTAMIGFFWNIMLALAWVALSGNFSGMNFVAGFFFAYLALMVLQRQVPVLKGYSRRIPRVVAFLIFFIKELAKANFRVAYDVATPVWYMKPGVIAFRLEARTDVEIMVLSSVISLTPGTLSLDVSDDKKVLFIHAMFLQDEEQLRQDLRELEHRILKILR